MKKFLAALLLATFSLATFAQVQDTNLRIETRSSLLNKLIVQGGTKHLYANEKRQLLLSINQAINIVNGDGAPTSPQARLAPVCVVSIANKAFHAYAVDKQGKTTVLGYNRRFNKIKKAISSAVKSGQCNLPDSVQPSCRTLYANNSYHLSMDIYGKSFVSWYGSIGKRDRALSFLLEQGSCSKDETGKR